MLTFIIEADGVLLDIRPAYASAHQMAVRDVGWSVMAPDDFWRRVRSKGEQSIVLPGIPPLKLKRYQSAFDEWVENEASWKDVRVVENLNDIMRKVSRIGTCMVMSCGRNPELRCKLLTSQYQGPLPLGEVFALDSDPRKRSAGLRAKLSGVAEGRAVAVVSTDLCTRTAREIGLLTVGISSGSCSAARLTQAGAEIVYRRFSEFANSLSSGAADLIDAGLAPAALQ